MLFLPYFATHGLRLLAPLAPALCTRGPARSGERIAYLTFDDGPTPQMTGRLLDVLDRHEARATHFLVGANAHRRPDLARALCEAGHTLGNHTWTHPDAWRTPAAQVSVELSRTTQRLEDLAQAPVRWMRPPYGHITPALLQWGKKSGQRCAMWDVMPGDFLRAATRRHLVRFVRRTIRPGSLIVLHDNLIAPHTPAALDGLLHALTAEGWRFEAL